MSVYTVSTSSELMENYIQARLPVAPAPGRVHRAADQPRRVAALLDRIRRCPLSDHGGAG